MVGLSGFEFDPDEQGECFWTLTENFGLVGLQNLRLCKCFSGAHRSVYVFRVDGEPSGAQAHLKGMVHQHAAFMHWGTYRSENTELCLDQGSAIVLCIAHFNAQDYYFDCEEFQESVTTVPLNSVAIVSDRKCKLSPSQFSRSCKH